MDKSSSEAGKTTVAPGWDGFSEALKPLLAKLNDLHAAVLFQALGSDRIIEFAAFDVRVRMHLPFAAVDAIQRNILVRHAFYEAPALAQVRGLIRRGAVVADIGANIGNHTLFFAMVCGAGMVHAFEPMRVTFELLRRNVALNNLSNVNCINAALGAEQGRADLLGFAQHNMGAARLLASETDTGDYTVTTLDAQGFDRLDFVKIDVEGAHLAVLEGARETLARHRPLIWIELRPGLGELETGDAALRALGYRQVRPLSHMNWLYQHAG